MRDTCVETIFHKMALFWHSGIGIQCVCVQPPLISHTTDTRVSVKPSSSDIMNVEPVLKNPFY